MKNKKLWITAVLLSGMLALPVQAAVISPGSENVRRSTVTKTAVSPKTGEGTGESVPLLLACVSASAAVFADRKRAAACGFLHSLLISVFIQPP